MAIIEPFSAIRYNTTKISKVICPPYDVISEEQKIELKELSPYNFVNIELPDSCIDARNKLNLWFKKNILIHDRKPSIYIYRQEFKIREKKFVRTGFFCILKLPPDKEKDKRSVIKHEKVSEKPVEDRLTFLRHIKVNTSPIFCLFNDDKNNIKRRLKRVIETKPKIMFKDRGKIIHKLWIITDRNFILLLKKSLAKKDVFIADGHHRFTVSAIYKNEMKRIDADYTENRRYNYVLTYLSAMNDPGLVILPTYRIVEKRPELELGIKKYFHSVPCDIKEISSNIVVYCNGQFSQLVPKRKSKDMPVVSLHTLLLDNTYAKHEIFYTKDINEAVKYASKIDGIAFFVDRPDIKQIFELSQKGKIMPHKTTYFYPKVPAGIVVYRLQD